MATLYGIVWVAILFAFAIYCLAFTKIWRNRHELRGLFNPFNEDPFGGTITTQIDITRESRRPSTTTAYAADAEAAIPGTEPNGGFDPYSVAVEVGPQDDKLRRPSRPEVFRVRSLTRTAALSETNPDAWLYARVAFLFFCALLISWVPSSINRLYSLANPNKLNFGLNYTETLVLPLEGFWNALVYIITSQTACRNLWRSVRGRHELLPRKNSGGFDGASGTGGGGGLGKALPLGKLGAVGGAGGGGKGRVDRFVSRRESVRLDSDVTSFTSLTQAHHR